MTLASLSLQGKKALVTGGSQGLGLGMALAMAEAGADVALVARTEERLRAAASQVEAGGRTAVVLPADLESTEVAAQVVDDAAEALGGLDILVTAAALQLRKPALEVTPEEWDRLTSVNLRSVYFTCQRAAHVMLRSEAEDGIRGKIINVASLTSTAAWPDVSIYGTTKGGVLAMTRAFALEWARYGILVNAVGPGTFHTELTDALYSDPERAGRITSRIPLRRPGRPEDLAGVTVFLASPASNYVTGQVIWVEGGWLLTSEGV